MLLLGLLAVWQESRGQGFTTTATPWPLPAGGYASTGRDYSYPTLFRSAVFRDASDHSWATADLNGDNRPDMVVLTEGTGSYQEPFGTAATGRYWKVYLNTGSGYSTSAVAWGLPVGGRIASGTGHPYSFDALSYGGSYYTGDQGWGLRDMNGDAKPDLVVLLEGNGLYADGFGLAATPYWKVYLNTGAGFAATAISWPLPAGGYTNNNHSFGFFALDYALGYQKWSVLDMNNDSRPDLVVLTENNGVLGTGSTGRYWKVYLNTGTGYATTPIAWALPTGGHVTPSGGIGGVAMPLSFDALAYANGPFTGDNSWAVVDIDGDNRPDLVVLTENNGIYDEPFGTGATGRYWKAYLSTGTGFAATATPWALPAGGHIDAGNGHLYSFDKLTAEGNNNTGDQQWTTRDMNGDRRPDLVVLTEGTGTGSAVFGTGSARYWKVYLNTNTGYSLTATTWALPPGGYVNYGVSYSFLAMAYAGSTTLGNLGCQSWAVLDLNGDNKQDLVVLTEGDGNFATNVFGTGTNRYWKAYLGSATGLATRPALGTGSLELFPNPATRAFTLRLPALGTERTAQLTLLNALGQVVQARSLELQPGGTDTQVNVGALAAGLYTVRVQAGAQAAAQQVLVE